MPGLGQVRNDRTRAEVRALFSLPFPKLMFEAQRVHRLHFDPAEVQNVDSKSNYISLIKCGLAAIGVSVRELVAPCSPIRNSGRLQLNDCLAGWFHHARASPPPSRSLAPVPSEYLNLADLSCRTIMQLRY
jgi:hypothetical protein